jgi:plastocyanin
VNVGARVGIVVTLLLAAGACGRGGSATGAGTSHLRRAAVAIRLVAYTPDELRVPTGSTVTWMQRDAGFHTVTSGTSAVDATGTPSTHPDGLFRSGRLPTDGRFSFEFDRAGTYRYFCEVHPATMRGLVTVE